MKRKGIIISLVLIAVIFILLFFMSLTGKKDKTEFAQADGLSPSVTKGGFYYADSRSRWYFFDTDKKESVILCNRPECTHESEEECAAFLHYENKGGMVECILAGTENLYLFENYQGNKVLIIKSDLDGTNQKKIAEVEQFGVDKANLVDGKIYFSGAVLEKDQRGFASEAGGGIIRCLDLNKNTVVTLANKEEDTKQYNIIMNFYDNKIIIYRANTNGMESSLWQMDVSSGEERRLMDLSDRTVLLGREQELWLTHREAPETLYKMDLETQKEEKIVTAEEKITGVDYFDKKVFFTTREHDGVAETKEWYFDPQTKEMRQGSIDPSYMQECFVISETENGFIISFKQDDSYKSGYIDKQKYYENDFKDMILLEE